MSLDIYLGTPDRCPGCGHDLGESFAIHSQNITHNLGRMAEEAGLYGPLWRPEENAIVRAADLIAPLEKGIAAMRLDPPRFEALNSKNGWGLYENFLPWLERLLEACRDRPDSFVRASR